MIHNRDHLELPTATIVEQAERALQESEERVRNLIYTIPAAIYTTDANGVITLYNQHAADMWGREPEVGKDMWCGSWKIYRPEDGSEMPLDACPMAVTLKTGVGIRNQEIIVERPDGRRAVVLPHPEPLRDSSGELIGAVNLLVDITARKQTEEQVLELSRSLEARVVDRTAQLEAFCYSVAHDLRQHIRSISLNAHFVSQSISDTDQETQESLHRLEAAAKNMDHLVRDLLRYARSSQQELRRETIDISRLAHELAAQLGSVYPGAEFRIKSGLSVQGDPALIGVVLENLLDNACKYAKAQETATVEVGRAGDAIYVQDNGQGFEMAYAERVFQPFERLHRQEDVPGTGIGLASVKQIIEKHGGKVWATSTLGEGSTFFFSIAD